MIMFCNMQSFSRHFLFDLLALPLPVKLRTLLRRRNFWADHPFVDIFALLRVIFSRKLAGYKARQMQMLTRSKTRMVLTFDVTRK